MSTFAVTAEQLVIHRYPDPEVERLELAQVGEYRAVVRKGQYKTGDWAVYIPEQAVVPEELLEEIGLKGKLAGARKNRVKAMRFKGELSQGIVCSPRALANVDLAAARACGATFADQLGIVKWVPEIPASLAGEVVYAPEMMSWIEIENIKRFRSVFTSNEPIVATEKIHGSATCITWVAQSGELWVSSKGFAAKKQAIVESDSNLYWRAVRAFRIEEAMRDIGRSGPFAKVALYGEVYGPGVQDLHYGEKRKDSPGFAVFDIAVGEGRGRLWLDQSDVRRLCGERNLRVAPVLYEGGYSYEALVGLTEGQSQIAGAANIREGLVVRANPERYSEALGGRAIAKFVGEGYLTRSGGTEYE